MGASREVETGNVFTSNTMPGEMIQQPVLVVLDPDQVNGVSPQSPTHTLLRPALPPAAEILYVKFPIPDIVARYGQMAHQGAEIMAANDSVIIVNCLHGTLHNEKSGREIPYVSLHYHIDARTLRCFSVVSTTPFDEAFTKLVPLQNSLLTTRGEYYLSLIHI